jgi:methionine--tRNA ligase beta chain
MLSQQAFDAAGANTMVRLLETDHLEDQLAAAERRVANAGSRRIHRLRSAHGGWIMSSPVKPLIDITLLDQVDVRVGTIDAVREVAGSDKLVQLQVNFGDHTRTVVAGLKKERGNPQEIEGRQALFVVNLRPRKMAGVLSEGMLFDIGYADGITPVLAMPEKPVPNGTRAG